MRHFQFLPRGLDPPKQVRVQALDPQPPIEAFDEPVSHWLAGAYEVKLHSVLISPGIQDLLQNSVPLSSVMDCGAGC
jgi:hypothetical protein